jgi:hypothetical protein
MAGLIDVGILKPELADYGRMEQQRNLLTQQKQQSELSQLKLDQLKQDQAMLTDLRTRLRAAGRSDDPTQFFQEMIRTGDPDYMSKGYEGLERYKDLKAYAKLGVIEPIDAAPAMPTGAPAPAAPVASVVRMPQATAPVNALGSGTFGMDQPAAPVNAMAPAAPAAAPVNALAAQPGAAQAARAQQRIDQLLTFARTNPRMAKQAMDEARILQDQLELYSKRGPNEPADVQAMQRLGYPLTQAGYQAFRDAQRPDRLLTAEELKQKLQIAAAGRAPGTTVTMVQEKAESGERGKMLVDQYRDISKSAGLAVKTLPSIEANLSALNKGFDTGFGKETVAAGASVLAALGVKNAEKFATDTQTFQSNAINGVLQKQLEQKGPQTESDAKRIEQIGAQLGKTKQANEFILAAAKEQLQRDIEQRNFYDRWYKTNKTYDGAEDAWFTGEGGKSLFDRPGLKKYAISASAASQIPGQRPVAPVAPNIDALLNKYK